MVMTTVDATLGAFFTKQLRQLAQETTACGQFEVHAVSSPGPILSGLAQSGDAAIAVHPVPMERQPRPLQDLISLWRLLRLMRRVRPQIVHAHTPKAGLLGMIAASLAGVKIRLYTVHGLPLETRRGKWRRILEMAETATCRLATQVYAVSHSLEQVVLQLDLCSANKLKTLGHGSCAGVDVELFRPDPSGQCRAEMRHELGIPSDARVITFVGRVARDKGIEVLAAAWLNLRFRCPDVQLVICGPDDTSDSVSEDTLQRLRQDERVHFLGERNRGLRAIYAASDVIALPTFREGLPQVALEAAAMEIPVVGTTATGIVLVPIRDAAGLSAALECLLNDAVLRSRLGSAARQRVCERYGSDHVNRLWMEQYQTHVREHLGVCPTNLSEIEVGRL
jgi:glycosyltransferase involved in cell wall biosynthesis